MGDYVCLEVHVYEKDTTPSHSSSRRNKYLPFTLVGLGNIRVKNEKMLVQTLPVLGGQLSVSPHQYVGLFSRSRTINLCSRLRSKSQSSTTNVAGLDFASSVFYWCEHPKKLTLHGPPVPFRAYASQQEGQVF